MSKVQDWRQLGLQSGDTLLCAGRSKTSGRIRKVQKLTGAKGQAADITHVAEVYKSPAFRTGITTWEYDMGVYESTSLNKWAGKSGVQMNGFEEWLDNYNGAVYVRKWDFERTINYYHQADVFIDEHKDDPYENGIPGATELVLCGLRLHRFVRRAFPDYVPVFTTEPHCTELIALKKKFHEQLRRSAIVNRLPPWMWWATVERFATVSISEPILIKEIE